MSKSFQLDIVTPSANLYSDEVDMVIVKTTEGDMGILYDHEITVAPLSVGAIKIKDGNDFKVAACSGGFVSIELGHVTVVTDSAEWADEIDTERAEASKKRAEERLETSKNSDGEVIMDRAQISLKRAINRIRIKDQYGR